MSYQREIRQMVAASVPGLSIDQVFVEVDRPGRLVGIKWQTSMRLTTEQRKEIAGKARAMLPATLQGYFVSVT